MAPPLKKPKSDVSDPKTPSSSSNDDEPPPTKLKPIASKPSSNAKKRSLESQKHSKQKKKQKNVDHGDEAGGEQDKEEIEKKKSMLIQRLWSDEDEIVILKGMIKNKKNGGVDPLSNLKQFLESIKKSLQLKEVKQEQLKNKIQRLKKKFVNNSKRAKGDEDPVFSKPHEKLSYTLMKEIWGSSGGNSGVAVADDKDVDDDDDDDVVANVKRSSSRVRKSQNAAENPVLTKWQGISMMEYLDDSNEDESRVLKKRDLQQKWRCLVADELKIYLRRLELVREQTVAILDAHKSLDASN